MSIRIGTRKSALATAQSELVRLVLSREGATLIPLDSPGDTDSATPLYDMGAPGVFTKPLEDALLRRDVDLAVHSLKDLPTEQPKGLAIVAWSKREISSDRLLTSPSAVDSAHALGLKRGARVGTSSLRREAMLLSQRPDLDIVSLRGNVPTRIRAVREGKVDATVLAAAGLHRLEADLSGVVAYDLPHEFFVCAPGQGVIAIECREEDSEKFRGLLTSFHDRTAEEETFVERQVLKGLRGGCSLPLGVRCHYSKNDYIVRAFLGRNRDREKQKREWLGFHYYDGKGSNRNEVVKRAVEFFKGLM